MIWQDHWRVKGQHAFLSASKYSWIRYDDEKIVNSFNSFLNVQRGTELHDLAAKLIKHGVQLKLSKARPTTLALYVNDAIGYKMRPEQVLYYSDNCFGTADAISFRDNQLRIHDLKTGEVPAHIEQLRIYAALFCLEYNYKPKDIKIELRIYQSNECKIDIPEPEDIEDIMNQIKRFDKILDKMKSEEEL